MCWFGRMENIQKKSHYARCQFLEELRNSLCGPLPKIIEKPWSIWIELQTVTDASARVSLLGTAGWTIDFLRTTWYWMCGSSQQGLQLVFDRFSAAYEQERTNISAKNIEVLCLSRRSRQCFLSVSEIHCSRWRRSIFLGRYSLVTEVGTKGSIHGLLKQTQFCVSIIPLWWQNGSF